jgi:predicted metal-dependent enzyme (double-stranded beta helix superfamily)
MTTGYTLDQFVIDLREITMETRDPREITRRLRPLVRALAVAPSWLAPQHAEPDTSQGFGIHVLHEEPDHSLMVFVAAWAPRRGVAPHNHGTWAVVAGCARPRAQRRVGARRRRLAARPRQTSEGWRDHCRPGRRRDDAA